MNTTVDARWVTIAPGLDGWLALRHATPLAVQAGEAILRRTVAHVESIGSATDGLDPSLSRALGTSVSDAVFRCGMQRGFLQSQAVVGGVSDEEAARAAMLPHADLVRRATIDPPFPGVRGDRFDHLFPERSAEPAVEGQLKALFPSLRNHLRQVSRRLDQQPFRRSRPQFDPAWQFEEPFDQPVIKEGNPDFQPVGHAHRIGVAEQCVGQIPAHLDG